MPVVYLFSTHQQLRWKEFRRSADKSSMETAAWLDWLTGGLAIVILVGGMIMLFKGVSAMK